MLIIQNFEFWLAETFHKSIFIRCPTFHSDNSSLWQSRIQQCLIFTKNLHFSKKAWLRQKASLRKKASLRQKIFTSTKKVHFDKKAWYQQNPLFERALCRSESFLSKWAIVNVSLFYFVQPFLYHNNFDAIFFEIENLNLVYPLIS